MSADTCLILVLVAFGLVLCAGCAGEPSGRPTVAPSPVPTPETVVPATNVTGEASVTLSLAARNMAFDRSTLAAPAGATVALEFTNHDVGIPHTFALYTDASASTAHFRGGIVDGPGTTTYRFVAPATPGTYHFRCDVHPETMNGSFIVT